MSKLCGKCGNVMDDSARVCGRCGSQMLMPTSNNNGGYNQNGYNQNRYNQNGYNQNGYNQNGYNQNGYNQNGYNQNGYNPNGFNQVMPPMVPGKKNKKGKKIVVSVAILVVIAIAVSLIGQSTGCKGTVKKFMNAFIDGDTEKIIDMSYDFVTPEFYEKYGLSEEQVDENLKNGWDSIIESYREYFEEELGEDDYDISYKIGEIESIEDVDDASEDDIDEVESYLSGFGLDIDMDDVRVAEVEVTAKSGSDKATIDYGVILIKDSGWKVLICVED